MHFFSSLHFQQISFTLLHFKMTHSKVAQGGGARWRLVARRARDIQFGLGEIQQNKKKWKTRRKLQTGHVQICTNTFKLDCVSMCVCVCVQKYRRPSKNQSARLEIVMAVKRYRYRNRPAQRVEEIHPLIASIRQQTLSTFEMDAARSRKQKPTTSTATATYVVENVQKICSKMLSKRDAT